MHNIILSLLSDPSPATGAAVAERIEETLNSIDSVDKAVDLAGNWFSNEVIPFLPRLLTAIIVLAVGWILSNYLVKLIIKIVGRGKPDKTVSSFLRTFLGILFKTFVAVTCMAILGINVTAIITALGAAGVAVALALQSNLSNVASGLIILVTKPFKVGDYVEINGAMGTVEEIRVLTTRMHTYDNKAITVPNSSITSNTLTNYTSEDLRRVDLKVSISYKSDYEKARQIIHEIVENDSVALTEPAPIIRMSGHADSAIIINVFVWCESADYWELYYRLFEKIKKHFDENGISIPFNQLDVHVKNDE